MVLPTGPEMGALDIAWSALADGDAARLPRRAELIVTGRPGQLQSRLPVEAVAVAAVGVALLAASALGEQRGWPTARLSLDRGHVSDAVRSERYFRRSDQPAGISFAPFSRFWRTADGWIRTHANYPWHRQALLAALGVDLSGRAKDDDVAGQLVAAAAARRAAEELQEAVVAAGGVAAAVRTPGGWQIHPQGQAVAAEPLIGYRAVGAAPARRRVPADLPAAGIRVLDLTRVIAGPVCTRFLGALGAQVLRIDPPRLPDMAVGEVSDTLLGKRSARLDLDSPGGQETLHRLLASADVVVHGYRPGSLERFGLSAERLAGRHPGLVVVQLDAWGHDGPWSQRRGFDSIVQAACGIAATEAGSDGTPGALPCQLLDHGTGYLAAAAALDGLRRQEATGGSVIRTLSLARTAMWLTSPLGPAPAVGAVHAGNADSGEPARSEWVVDVETPIGLATAVAPPGRLDGRPLTWPSMAGGYGAAPPAWAPG
jgi:crotonobetainyl-CoA:carnitine CoA-transferase CaiB-like acyl-CoA transferase